MLCYAMLYAYAQAAADESADECTASVDETDDVLFGGGAARGRGKRSGSSRDGPGSADSTPHADEV